MAINNKKSTTKTKKLAIPFDLICDKKINHGSVYLYTILKDNIYQTNEVNIFNTKLKSKLNWKDNKTMKKYLSQLRDYGYIGYEFCNLPNKTAMQIHIRPLQNKEYYILITSKTLHVILDTFNKIEPNMTDQAVRLYMYYIKNYNTEYGYAFTSYKNIKDDTGIRNENIKIINNIFRKEKIVFLQVGDRYLNEQNMNLRERNKYQPLLW